MRRFIIIISLLMAVAVATAVLFDPVETAPLGGELLAKDVHVDIAERRLTFPLIALGAHAHQLDSLFWNRRVEESRKALQQFVRSSADPANPLVMGSLTVAWVDRELFSPSACSRLGREWAKTFCSGADNPIGQALPYRGFELVDLRRDAGQQSKSILNCDPLVESVRPAADNMAGEALICLSKSNDALLLMGGYLAAVWTVWEDDRNGETAEAMASREGKAILALVKHAVGPTENYAALLADMCRLRRPVSVVNNKAPTNNDVCRGTTP